MLPAPFGGERTSLPDRGASGRGGDIEGGAPVPGCASLDAASAYALAMGSRAAAEADPIAAAAELAERWRTMASTASASFASPRPRAASLR